MEFQEQKDGKKKINYFLVIDSKKQEISINCENIEEIDINEHDQLAITYYISTGKSDDKLLRKTDIMECCEN